MRKEHRYHCNNCETSFSARVGTIFHHTHLPLQKWFLAISIVLNAKKGIAARQLARDLEVTKDTGWSMAMRIRRAMTEHPEQRALLQGVLAAYETEGNKPGKGSGPKGPHKREGGAEKVPVVRIVEAERMRDRSRFKCQS